jgi:hypothetical protein
LYGLEEAPYHFNKLLDTKLKDLGFIQSRADLCLYTRVVDKVKNKRPQTGSKISYLGLSIIHDKSKNQIKISQKGMVIYLVKKFELDRLKKFPTNPTIAAFLKSDPLAKILENNK